MGSPKVKVKAQVLIQHNDKVLVYRVIDEKTGAHIYRLIGGRVEFGELSEKAAIREFIEETHIEVKNPKHIGCFESIYILHGKQKHELVKMLSQKATLFYPEMLKETLANNLLDKKSI